ncbi:MAG: hypothetical protein ACRDIE_20960, partial [Chloroflexota bacterium]
LQADQERKDVIGTLLKPEMCRILARKRGEGGSRKLTDGEINDFVSHVISGAGVGARLGRLEGLVNELIIARHFARAADQAEGRRTGGAE